MFGFLFGVAVGAAGYWAWKSFGQDVLGMSESQGGSSYTGGGDTGSTSTGTDSSYSTTTGSTYGGGSTSGTSETG